MLRSDAQVAVDDVALACRRAEIDYADSAELAGDDALAHLFTRLGNERRAMAEELGMRLKDLGETPTEPDPDRRSLAKLARHIKVAMVNEERLTLVRERERAEEELAEQVARTLEHEVPETTRATLERFARHVTWTLERLASARCELTAEHASGASA